MNTPERYLDPPEAHQEPSEPPWYGAPEEHEPYCGCDECWERKGFVAWSVYAILPCGSLIVLPDGREGTICYNMFDGQGGVWGDVDFGVDPEDATYEDDRLPAPKFMLREPYSSAGMSREYVGERYRLLRRGRA